MSDLDRPLPSSPEAEKGILSSILNGKNCMSECSVRLTPEHFHVPAHRTIYGVLLELWKDNKPMDFIALTGVLKDRGKLDACGGPAEINDIYTYVPTASNLLYYIGIVEEKEHLRRIIHAANAAIAGAYEAEPPEELVQKLCAEIPSRTSASERPTFQDLLDAKLERMEKDEPDSNRIWTGIKKLDEHSPLKRKNMVAITGTRKAGKSMLSLTIATNVADSGIEVAYYSLEDGAEEVVDRLFARKSRVPIVKQHGSVMNEGEFRRVSGAYAAMSEWGFHLRDDVMDCSGIMSDVRRLKAAHPNLWLVVVDYLQLVKGDKSGNREQEVSGVGRDLRLLAMETGCAILVLSQENDDGNTRESKATEQHITACWQIVEPDEDEDQKQRKIRIPYQRNGERNLFFRTSFLGEYSSYENYSGQEEPL